MPDRLDAAIVEVRQGGENECKRAWHREAWRTGGGSGVFPLFICSCNQPAQPPLHRVELRKTGGQSFELVPMAGTPSNCLAFSVAESGVVRQLTMNADDTSANCEPGKPIGGQPFQIPAAEGKVRDLHHLLGPKA